MKKTIQVETRKGGRIVASTTITVDTRTNLHDTGATVRAVAARLFHETLPARIHPKLRRALS